MRFIPSILSLEFDLRKLILWIQLCKVAPHISALFFRSRERSVAKIRYCWRCHHAGHENWQCQEDVSLAFNNFLQAPWRQGPDESKVQLPDLRALFFLAVCFRSFEPYFLVVRSLKWALNFQNLPDWSALSKSLFGLFLLSTLLVALGLNWPVHY